jgi:putative membrane protein
VKVARVIRAVMTTRFFTARLNRQEQTRGMHILWLSIFFVVLIWSGINPKDYFTWFLETAPAVLGFIALAVTYKRFRLTNLTYTLILIQCIILMVGGHYTYAKVPPFDWIKDIFALQRNNYDKLGHLAQGFVPAIIAREVFIRKSAIRKIAWLNFFVVCFCLALSALYELIEWLVAITTGASSEAFLGTQGYVWDTQTDMAGAFVGAVLALVLFSKFHDKQLRSMKT